MRKHNRSAGRIAISSALAMMSLLAMRCSDAPITPTPPGPPPPPPPVNTPPVIQSLTAGSPRVEADNQIELTAVVVDAETQVDQLQYSWSATPATGTFIGSGQRVRWQAPHLQATPDLYTVKLTVTEKYTAGSEAK